MKLVFIILILSGAARAEDLQLLFGGGSNISTFYANNRGTRMVSGLNFKTDLGYNFDEHWTAEWSSHIKFGSLNRYLIWDTLMTVGGRYHLSSSQTFLRAFVGRSPTDLIPRDGFQQKQASRIRFSGVVYGAAVGEMYQTKGGMDWFIEGIFTFQRLKNAKGLRDMKDGSDEIVAGTAEDTIEMFTLFAVIGLRVF